MNSVSVIIPTWNRAHTIGAAIESVLAQTNPVHEVLVCDDGSTDNTVDVVAAFRDERVKLIGGARAGRPAVPRNRGIAQATGKWIAFLDSDDTWLPEKLKMQMELAASDRSDACCTNAWRLLPEKGRVSAFFSEQNKTIHLSDLLHVNSVICSSALVKKELIVRAGGFPEAENLKAIEDYALWLRIASMTAISFCGKPLVDYMDDAANSVRSEAKENVQRENVMNDFYAWYVQQQTQENRGLVKTALRKAMKNNGRSFLERWKFK